MDISKIKIESGIYDVKDTISREHLYFVYDTVAQMKADKLIKANTFVETRGFSQIGKGGAIYYITSETQTVDNIRIFNLQNDLFAILQDNGNISSYGANETGNTDCTNILNVAIAHNNVLNLEKEGIYLISENIELPSNFKLNGNFATIKTSTTNIEMLTANQKENITIQDLFIQNSMRGTTFYNCNNIVLNNIKFTTTNWATLFRLCKHVKATNLYFAQAVPENYNNTDGIHINGLVDALFENIYGFTGDDMLALNADETNQNYGDIKDVVFKNVRTDLNTSYNLSQYNSAYRCIRFLAINNKIENITFENCNFTNYSQDLIIADNTANTTLINSIYFKNCEFTSNVNDHFLMNSVNRIGTIQFLDCKITNNSSSSVFNVGNIDNLYFNNIRFTNNNSSALYFINITNAINKLTILNFFAFRSNALNLIMARATVTTLILDSLDYSSTTNWVAQTTGKDVQFSNAILNNIKKCVNSGIIYHAQTNTSIILANNVDTSILTAGNQAPARLVGGVSSLTPTAPQNGDSYIYKNGDTYTNKIYSNSAWT